MRAFCDCGREHQWQIGKALCPCGKVLDPQTNEEARERKMIHGTRIALIIQRNTLIRSVGTL
jgi:hypothetical protein